MNALNFRVSAAVSATLLCLAGCGPGQEPDTNNPDNSQVGTSRDELSMNGAELFHFATFGGNDRTCAVCHTDVTGTINPQQLQAIYKYAPQFPIFRAIDSDDGKGKSYNRLLTNATILVHIPLPAGVTLADDPTATSVTLQRGIPTTLNTPALDPVLMSDGRAPSLTAQALDAVHSHYQATKTPTSSQVQLISSFEKTLFSSYTFERYAHGGAAPTLPTGRTDSEKRGRAFFVDSPTAPGSCAICHAGPMLNQMSAGNFFGLPGGSRYFTALVSELNDGNLPVHNFVIKNPDGTTTTLPSSDPGRFLITGDPNDFGLFKIPSLWNVKNTAPYFHDNSAKTLTDLVNHYQVMLPQFGLPPLSDQDKQDIVNYLNLL